MNKPKKQAKRKNFQMDQVAGNTAEKSATISVSEEMSEQFMAAYDQWAQSLFRYAYFRVNSKELAQDMVSQAFLNTWQYVQRGQIVRDWRLFLFRTTRNLIFDYYRIKKNQPVFLSDVIRENYTSDRTLPEKMNRKLEARLILEEFARLESSQAEILELKFIEGLDAQEIGQLVGKSRNAVYVDIHRALKKIKRSIN